MSSESLPIPSSAAVNDLTGTVDIDDIAADNVTINSGAALKFATSTTNFTMGINTSDSNKFVISRGTTLAADPIITVDPNTAASLTPNITWTSRTVPAQTWNDVTWAPALSLAVAVGSTGTGNRVTTSPDGITWTSRTSAADNTWQSVCWSPELTLFVAVSSSGTGNRVMTSPDGITWTSRTSAADNQWNAVAWSPTLTLFVAVAGSGTNRVMTSPDGTTWTSRTPSDDTTQWQDVVWASGLSLFVAVGVGTNRVMTSANGTAWTSRTTDTDLYKVEWASGLSRLVAINTDNAAMRSSTDGTTWTTVTTGLSSRVTGELVWASSIGVLAVSGTAGLFTKDLTTWYNMSSDLTTNNITWAPSLSRFISVSSTSGFTGVYAESAFAIVSLTGTVKIPSYDTNGTVTTISADGSLSISSDRRLKNTITYLPDDVDYIQKISQLKPCTFKFNTSDNTMMGFIAQEVEEVIPEAVDGKRYEYKFLLDANGKIQLGPDGQPLLDYTKPRYRGLSDVAIIATVVKAMQKIINKNQELENEINILKNK